MASRRLMAALAVLLLGAGRARADEVRYYERDGVTYCETRRTVQERVPQSRMEDRTQTVYREECTTEMRETTRVHRTPVTEYRWEAYWVGRWNPLVKPYLAYRYVPRTHWQERTEVVKVPVAIRRSVPETRTVRQPVAGWRTVQREVVSRVAVAGTPTATPLTPIQAPALARRGQIGGVSRVDGAPPRYGANTAWRASAPTIRR